jgi:hypothetical protein
MAGSEGGAARSNEPSWVFPSPGSEARRVASGLRVGWGSRRDTAGEA